MDTSLGDKKRRIREAVLGGLLGIGGGIVALLVGAAIERLFVPGGSVSAATGTTSVLAAYSSLLVGYFLIAVRYRVFGLFAVLLHVLVWSYVPFMFLIGLPV
jgi:hypothetical protein